MNINFYNESNILKINFLFLFILSFLVQVGCGKSTEKNNSSSSSEDTAGGGNQSSPPSSVYFYVHGKSTEGIDVNTHLASDWTKKCQVDLDDTTYANRDIYCTVEVKELDLFHQGLKLFYNVPASNKCAYVNFLPYYFYQYKSGYGPTEVTKTIAADGTITFSDRGDGESGSTVVNKAGNETCGLNWGAYYPDSGYPNCCLGKYNLIIKDSTSGSEVITTESNKSWGGSLGACLGGAGKDHYPSKVQNFPQSVIYRLGGTSGTSLENSYSITAPISLELGSNLHIANYLSNPSSPPLAFSAPTTASSYVGNPYYDWICFDEAAETYARIRVSVREWNTQSEFIKGSLGDPDATGAETDWGWDINDFDDWKDFIDRSFSGNYTFGFPDWKL